MIGIDVIARSMWGPDEVVCFRHMVWIQSAPPLMVDLGSWTNNTGRVCLGGLGKRRKPSEDLSGKRVLQC